MQQRESLFTSPSFGVFSPESWFGHGSLGSIPAIFIFIRRQPIRNPLGLTPPRLPSLPVADDLLYRMYGVEFFFYLLFMRWVAVIIQLQNNHIYVWCHFFPHRVCVHGFLRLFIVLCNNISLDLCGHVLCALPLGQGDQSAMSKVLPAMKNCADGDSTGPVSLL